MNRKMKLIFVLGGVTVGSFGFCWTFLQISAYFGWEPFKNTGVMGFVWLISISLYIGLILTAFYYIIHKEEFESEKKTPKSKIAEALLNQLKSLAKSSDYSSIIRFGSVLSRPLWLEGEYRIRIEVGQIVEDAAVRLDNKKVQATALIDDLGWTYVALKQFNEADKNIEHGKQIAAQIPDYYLVSKALRHQGGMAIERNLLDEAVKFLEQAIREAEKIEDKENKEEMIAGIEYAFSVVFWMKKELNKAKDYCLGAKTRFEIIGDNERIAKTFAQLGKIGEKSGDLEFAKDIYRKGLEFAQRIKRKDEIIRNHLGLARILLKEGKNRKAKEHLKIAKRLSESTPLVFEAGTIEADLDLLKRREVEQ